MVDNEEVMEFLNCPGKVYKWQFLFKIFGMNLVGLKGTLEKLHFSCHASTEHKTLQWI